MTFSNKRVVHIVCTLGIGVLIIAGIIFTNVKLNAEKASLYSESFDEAVDKSNKGFIDFYFNSYDGVTMALSPLSMQSALYSYSNKESFEDYLLFEKMSNGFKDWSSSYELFEDESISTFTTGDKGDVASDIAGISSLVSSNTDGYIDNLVFVDKLEQLNIVGVCSIPYKLGVSAKSKESLIDYIWFKEDILYKNDGFTESICVPLSDKRYDLYLIKPCELYEYDTVSSVIVKNGINFEGYSTKNLGVSIKDFTWSVTGSPNKFVDYILNSNEDSKSNFRNSYYNLLCINKFGFSKEDYEYDDNISSDKTDLQFFSNYAFIIKNKETGCIVMLGTMK